MISGKNNILAGYTGKLGDTGLYKRTVNGKEIIQRCPVRKKKNSRLRWPAQVDRFFLATKYAKRVLVNPEIKALYAQVATGFNSANSMAVKDFLTSAVISRVVTTGYHGRAGYRMVIRVDNVVPVKSVTVTIENPDGDIIESGPAAMHSSGTDWHYITTRPNLQYAGSLVRVVSCDLPGNTAEWTRVL
ncbi:MAG: hypothetical protein NT040_10135 [Bacteroidetes bacterium]|nr:hypothetical protein [Bacteroidota bacterium]